MIEDLKTGSANSKNHLYALSQPSFIFALEQHVLDMLRDKLEFTQSELADAKNQSAETQAKQAKDSIALQASSIQINNLGGSFTHRDMLLVFIPLMQGKRSTRLQQH